MVCSKCRTPKDEEEFYSNAKSATGHDGSCKSCRRGHERKRREERVILQTDFNDKVCSMTWDEIADRLHLGRSTVLKDYKTGMTKIREKIKSNPELAESLWMFMEKELDKSYRNPVPYAEN